MEQAKKSRKKITETGNPIMKMKTLKTNQIAVELNHTVTFFSYDTEVARIARNPKMRWELEYVTDKADYSQTTKRYLYQFLREYNVAFEIKGEQHFAYEAEAKHLKKLVDAAEVRPLEFTY